MIMRISFFSMLAALIFLYSNCSNAQPKNPIKEASNNSFKLEKVVDEVEIPWGITQLPDGSLLYTEKEGPLIHFKDGKKTFIKNVPPVFAHGQGGLLDIVLHPKYSENGWIYIALSVSPDGKKGNTRIIRAKLENDALTNIETLYQAAPNTGKPYHFGSRIAFDPAGYLYFSVGDRGNRDENPQDVKRDGGKIYRLQDNGEIPADNPFYGQENAKKAIYTYGHRNPQGLVMHPQTGKIWESEHGPKGGDEINILAPGNNYGWPVITYGKNYIGTKITDETARPGMEQPIHYWVPSIAPCGMEFITSDYYGDWKGDLLLGSLKFSYLHRCVINGEKVEREERLFDKVGRVRDVYQAPDGFIYVSIEYEGIFKIVKS